MLTFSHFSPLLLISSHQRRVPSRIRGENALGAMDRGDGFDLVLMDIDLGDGMDGTEAARQILLRRNVPIAFLTSHMEKEYVDRAKAISSYGYVVKDTGE
ncbi:MAG: response regulator, partial [Spirochaetaceae bacterium]